MMYKREENLKTAFAKSQAGRVGFTPLHPESPGLQTGDEWHIKLESAEKPRPLGRGVTGFTLVELMLVVIIIGVLVAMVVPRMAGRSEEARVSVAQADVDLNIATALKLYELDNGVFPTTEEGLEALLSVPSSARNWKGPYLEKKPLDPWGKAYQYKSPGTHRSYDYDLYSLGRDGVESQDDVVNWQKQ